MARDATDSVTRRQLTMKAIFRFLMLVILFGYSSFSKQSLLPKGKKIPWMLLIIIGFFDVCAFFAYSIGVSNAYGAIVAPISSAYSVVTVVLGVMILKEKIQFRQILGIAAILCGLVIISI